MPRLFCKEALDLGLVIDTTRSIRRVNVPVLKEALQQLVKRFTISTGKTHVSMITFAGKSKLHNTFKDPAYHSQNAILRLISNHVKRLRSPTRLDRAMKAADEKMFTPENGLRPGIGKVMVLYTDGRTNPSSDDFTAEIAALKVRPEVLITYT